VIELDTSTEYHVEYWRSALAAAEEAEFDEVDAREQSGEYGPLSAWLAEQYTHDKIDRDRDRLAAVITALDEEYSGDTVFSAGRFETVMLSMKDGETGSDHQELVEEWIKDEGGSESVVALVGALVHAVDRGDEDDPLNWNKIFDTVVCPEAEMYVENEDGGTFYYFDKNKW
jgi:hypothetical protein